MDVALRVLRGDWVAHGVIPAAKTAPVDATEIVALDPGARVLKYRVTRYAGQREEEVSEVHEYDLGHHRERNGSR